MIRALIFDNNGVLTTLENDVVARMAALLGVGFDEYFAAWKKYSEPLDYGGITTIDFFTKVLGHFNSSVEIEELLDLYLECYDRDDEMHEIVRDLGKRYEVALLSNFGDFFDTFEKKWRTTETIKPENIFVSVKLKMRKPNRDIYKHALSKMALQPHEAIFVDDRLENVVAAKEIGMSGIVFKNKKQFLSELKEITAND